MKEFNKVEIIRFQFKEDVEKLINVYNMKGYKVISTEKLYCDNTMYNPIITMQIIFEYCVSG